VHSLLRRQIKRHSVDYETLPENLKGLVEVVDQAYSQFDEDRGMLERAFELSSEELLQANQELARHREQLERLVDMRTRELKKANSLLVSEIAERKRIEERLAHLNECIISFTEDHGQNMQRLIDLCGTSLNAQCAFYNRIGNHTVEPVCKWKGNPETDDSLQYLDHKSCLAFMKNPVGGFCVNTFQRATHEDPPSGDMPYRFEPCIGVQVSLSNGQKLGSLCVVCRDYEIFSEGDKRFLSLLASALRSEVERGWVAVALKESEERFRSISMSAQDAIVMTDSAGNISYWNPAAERIFGHVRDAMLGQPIQAYITSPAFHNAMAEAFMEWRATGHGRSEGRIIELETERKDGVIITLELSLSSVMLGNSVHAIGIFRDVSERKKSEVEIRASEERLKTILESIQTGIALIDPGDHRITFVNRAAANLIGSPARDIVGQTCHNYICPADRGRCPVTDLGQTVDKSERTLLGKEGKAIPVLKEVARMSLYGRETLVESFVDITAQKHAEQELRKAMEVAEAANRAKSQFLANMSHEIRTPMNGVLGMTELLRNTGLTAQQRHIADTIGRSGETLLTVINDILDFSKIEAGKMELQALSFSLRRTIAEVQEMLSEKVLAKGLELRSVVSNEVPDSLIGDGARLQQILINLVANAVKFTEVGGVTIHVSCFHDDGKTVELRFEVKDTGIGVPEEAQSSIFDSFSQADGSATRRYGGSGLGLSISKQLCEMMGGGIGVESERGRGSVFWFTARLGRENGTTVGTTEPTTPERLEGKADQAPSSLRVLVVEDNQVNQEVAKAMLESFGHLVDVVGDGIEAVAAVTSAPYDIILMDCQMPRMDGYEATGQIREWERSKAAQNGVSVHVPIVALTAHAIIGDRERCLASGMDDYLTKPFKLQALSDILARHTRPKQVSTEETRMMKGRAPSYKGTPVTEGGETNRNPFPATPIDRSALDKLRGLQMQGAPDVVTSIIDIYLANSSTLFGDLQQALGSGDSAVLRRTSHTLKSSSANVGAMSLSDMCRELESLAREERWLKDGDKTMKLVAAIEAELMRVQDALGSELTGGM
jgi:PAS domain S-box-containing protein